MPEISRFYGIVIRMYFGDHPPPHFHADYGDSKAVLNIQTLGIVAGHLPPRALALVVEWAALHQRELLELWTRAENLQPLGSIAPLD